jgi:hypothetical protein
MRLKDLVHRLIETAWMISNLGQHMYPTLTTMASMSHESIAPCLPHQHACSYEKEIVQETMNSSSTECATQLGYGQGVDMESRLLAELKHGLGIHLSLE